MLLQLAALCFIASPLLAQMPTSPEGAGNTPTTRMQQLMQRAVAEDHFTGAALVVKDGAILLDEGYGAADLEWKVPNSPASRFRIGSLTKQFTSASILLLEERGKLRLEDHVCKYMADCPAAWQPITLYEVLTHTAGIPNFTSFPDYRATEWQDTTPTELVARFKDKPLDFAPGSDFSYSNSGYVLLGYLLEKITGRTYAEFLQANIFSPLGMVNTGVDSNRAILLNRARGYHYGEHGFEHAGYTSMTIPFSAGNLYSTTGDLLKWELALFGGKVLKPESLKKMTTPNKGNYALGVGVLDEHGHRMISHNGGIEGFVTYLTEYPEDKLTIVVLANSDTANPSLLGSNLGQIALGLPVVAPTPPAARTEVSVPATALADLPGVYRLTPSFAITITLEDGKLMAQATKQSKFQIYPESPSRFFYKVVNAEIDFNRESNGKITSLILLQNGAAQKGTRE